MNTNNFEDLQKLFKKECGGLYPDLFEFVSILHNNGFKIVSHQATQDINKVGV